LAFTPSSTESNGRHLSRQGFATVAQGITAFNFSIKSAKFRGTATDSDALGGVSASANYVEIRPTTPQQENSQFKVTQD
jgi:hypothetical protein